MQPDSDLGRIGSLMQDLCARRCLFNTFLVLCQTSIGIAFVTLMYTGQNRQSGYLEWTLCYFGSFWLASFYGYTRYDWLPIPLQLAIGFGMPEWKC